MDGTIELGWQVKYWYFAGSEAGEVLYESKADVAACRHFIEKLPAKKNRRRLRATINHNGFLWEIVR